MSFSYKPSPAQGVNSNIPRSTNQIVGSSILNHGSLQTLCVFYVDGLYVAVQPLLGTLLVVSLSRDPHAESVRDTLDSCLPDLLVELRIQTNIGRALCLVLVPGIMLRNYALLEPYHGQVCELLDLLDRPGSALLE